MLAVARAEQGLGGGMEVFHVCRALSERLEAWRAVLFGVSYVRNERSVSGLRFSERKYLHTTAGSQSEMLRV